LLFGAAVAGVLAFALSSWVGRRVTVGLRRLADATEALERGRLDQPVGIGGHDEMARVALAFESLARELADRSRVADDTLHRLGHDLAEPLVTLRDATRVLADELDAEPRQQQLAQLIGDAADDLVRRVDRITENPTAPQLEGPALTLLRAPLRMLPEPAPNDEERV
jgi:signal transduction histidine kinase